MGCPDDAPSTARGVLSFTSPPLTKFAGGCSLDRGGETHILHTLGEMEQGIVLIFIPLLRLLLANVMHKFEEYISWKETVFDCVAGGISRIQVDALFLFLTMARMIHL